MLLLLTNCPSCTGQETLCKGFISNTSCIDSKWLLSRAWGGECCLSGNRSERYLDSFALHGSRCLICDPVSSQMRRPCSN